MRVTVGLHDLNVSYNTRRLLRRMLSPLCGLDQAISFLLPSRHGPRFVIAGAELTGVHVLRGQPRPTGVAPYHIGGGGIVPDEALIRSLGESVERYSQFVSGVSRFRDIVIATYPEVAHRGGRALAPDRFGLFSERQYSRTDFPFQPYSADMPLGWVRAFSLIDDEPVWVPAQMTLVGYLARSDQGEKRISPAVTTGSAAHTKPELALRNALLELVQIDSAIGHWYSAQTASEILYDERTAPIQRLIASQFPTRGPVIKFFWLPNADLPGTAVACTLNERNGQVPAVCVGLGIDLNLVKAMYKALLEAVGVFGLSKYTLLDLSSDSLLQAWTDVRLDPKRIYDLDSNVAYYALPENAAFIEAKFSNRKGVRARDLPPDSCLDPREEVCLLIEGFQRTNKELVFLDLTTSDIRELGFTCVRVWSPDTLNIPLPSAPPLQHSRFTAYGGAKHETPHPYP